MSIIILNDVNFGFFRKISLNLKRSENYKNQRIRRSTSCDEFFTNQSFISNNFFILKTPPSKIRNLSKEEEYNKINKQKKFKNFLKSAEIQPFNINKAQFDDK